MLISIMLLIDLMHSFSNCLSALLIISEAFLVKILVLSLILTGMMLFFKHLIMNLLGESLCLLKNIFCYRENQLQIHKSNRMRNLHAFKKKFNLHLITIKGYHIVCYHVGQMYSPEEASSDKEQYYVRSA